MDWRLLASSVLAALAFALVGARLLARTLPPEHRAAGRAFGAAWIASAACAGATALAEAGLLPPLAAAWASLAFGAVVLGGTVGYLGYLLTGHRLAVPLALALYLVELVVAAAVTAALAPAEATTAGFMTRFVFEGSARGAAGWLAVAYLGPAALASLCYLGVLPVAGSPTARWRVALVGGGLSLWSLAALAARIAPAGPLAPLPRVAGLLLAAAVLLAYMPPAWAQRRWGIEPVEGEVLRESPSRAERAARAAALGQRARELI